MFLNYKIYLPSLILVLIFLFSCKSDKIIIVPAEGYAWPNNERAYWPTDGWISSDMEDHKIDLSKIKVADQFAESDPLSRALLVIKDGYIVFENYYGDGGIEQSTNLWSVTKSVSSALVGILIDQKTISSTDQLMSELMPAYPQFNKINLHHVLTQTTGLSWAESGPLWVDWIFSDDWVASALARGQIREPGERFFYSSGNSHFLTSLVYYNANISPGKLAKEQLFDPMGIPFDTLKEPIISFNL